MSPSPQSVRPALRAALLSRFTRFYPFLSGCTFPNHPLFRMITGSPAGVRWAPVDGGSVLVELDDFIGRAVYFVGDLDRKISKAFDCVVRPGDTVLDIGANIGVTTMRLARLVGQHGRVFAFEPNPRLASRLRTAAERNDRPQITVIETALGASPGEALLSVPAGNAGAASLSRDVTGLGKIEKHPVRVIRLDDLAGSWPTISLMKIDVEGAECEVINGARETITRALPVIIFEMNAGNNDALINAFADLNYAVFGLPKCLLNLRLEPVACDQTFHDYIAIPKRGRFAEITAQFGVAATTPGA